MLGIKQYSIFYATSYCLYIFSKSIQPSNWFFKYYIYSFYLPSPILFLTDSKLNFLYFLCLEKGFFIAYVQQNTPNVDISLYAQNCFS